MSGCDILCILKFASSLFFIAPLLFCFYSSFGFLLYTSRFLFICIYFVQFCFYSGALLVGTSHLSKSQQAIQIIFMKHSGKKCHLSSIFLLVFIGNIMLKDMCIFKFGLSSVGLTSFTQFSQPLLNCESVIWDMRSNLQLIFILGEKESSWVEHALQTHSIVNL